MLRSILAVIAGYAVMAIVVMIAFVPSVVAPDYVWRGKDTLELYMSFVIFTLAWSLLAAMAGGYVCAWIGRGFRSVVVLGALMLFFGMLMAVGNLKKEPPNLAPEKIAAMSIWEKAENGREPNWYAFTTPVIGAVGTILGGRLRKV